MKLADYAGHPAAARQLSARTQSPEVENAR